MRSSIFTFVCFLAAATIASAQPSITGTTGTLTHGSAVTLIGAGFGSKSAPQRIWDTAEGTDLRTLWDVWEPTTAANTTCNMGYRTPIRNVALPHTSGNTKYMAGCHYGLDTSSGGNDVNIAKSRTVPGYPYYSYWAYYWRMDPAWDNCCGENTDGNNKIHIVATTPGLVDGTFWYNEYDVRPTSPSVTPVLDVSDTGGMGYRCRTAVVGACHSSGAGNVGYGTNSNNPINGWIKFEIMVRWDRTTNGYMIMYENGRKVYHSTGETDTNTSTNTRWEAIGYYSRARGITNWRYFDDIYFDYGTDAIAHLEICPGSTFANRGVCSTQPLVSWNNSSINFTLNRGGLAANSTAYVYVTDSARNTNSNGFPIVLGSSGSSSNPPPPAPTGLHIVSNFRDVGLLGAVVCVLGMKRRFRNTTDSRLG